jgi:hypothetical protein
MPTIFTDLKSMRKSTCWLRNLHFRCDLQVCLYLHASYVNKGSPKWLTKAMLLYFSLFEYVSICRYDCECFFFYKKSSWNLLQSPVKKMTQNQNGVSTWVQYSMLVLNTPLIYFLKICLISLLITSHKYNSFCIFFRNSVIFSTWFLHW